MTILRWKALPVINRVFLVLTVSVVFAACRGAVSASPSPRAFGLGHPADCESRNGGKSGLRVESSAFIDSVCKLPDNAREYYARFVKFRPPDGMTVHLNPPRFSWAYVPAAIILPSRDSPSRCPKPRILPIRKSTLRIRRLTSTIQSALWATVASGSGV
ncbi:MAG: hypothetical protein ACYS4T_05675 [Planctomycetota bacterium]